MNRRSFFSRLMGAAAGVVSASLLSRPVAEDRSRYVMGVDRAKKGRDHTVRMQWQWNPDTQRYELARRIMLEG